MITETASVHESDWPYERAPLATECVAGWAAIVEGVKAVGTGTVVLASLGHSGGQGSSAYSRRALFGPSRFPDPATREVPQEMEPVDIADVVGAFAEAARLAMSTGVDGVEINAGQLSLIRQFLSGLTNQRSDDFGADRLRFARQVIDAVRDAVGPGPVVGLRLGCDELAPWAGITPEASPEMAGALAGPLDYIAAVRAPAFDVGGTRPDGHTEPGFAVPLAASLREVLPAQVAVMAQGSIVDPAMAEAIVAAGSADLIEMTRAQIADPDLGAKCASGRSTQVRPCVLCNQRCQVRDRAESLGQLHRGACVGLRDRRRIRAHAAWITAPGARDRCRSRRTRSGPGSGYLWAHRRSGRRRLSPRWHVAHFVGGGRPAPSRQPHVVADSGVRSARGDADLGYHDGCGRARCAVGGWDQCHPLLGRPPPAGGRCGGWHGQDRDRGQRVARRRDRGARSVTRRTGCGVRPHWGFGRRGGERALGRHRSRGRTGDRGPHCRLSAFSLG